MTAVHREVTTVTRPRASTKAATPSSTPPSVKAPTETVPRLAVLWVPDWPVVAAMIEQDVPADVPVAVHDARAVLAASAQARAAGVRRGMRRRLAQELCPELVLIPADTGRDVRAFEPLVQACEEVAAEIEVVRPGMLVLASAGPARYLGGEDVLAETLVGTVATITGTECQVGIAEGYLAAVLAAREGVIVPPGGAARFMAPHDVRALLHVTTTREATAQWADLADLLRRLGIPTLGAFAALRSADVTARFGDTGATAYRLAHGLDARRAVVHRPDPDITMRAELDPPAATVDIAAFAARRLAEDLQNALLRRGSLCGRLQVAARTTDGAELVRTWRIGGALTARELTDRVRWQLEGWLAGRSGRAPSAPVARLEITACEVIAAGSAQDGLWGRRTRGEEQASRAAVRVQGVIGADRVLVPVPEGGRSPRDRVRTVAWGDESSPRRSPQAPWPGQLPPPLPTIVPIEPPVVELLDADGRKVRVDERGALTAIPALLEMPDGPDSGGPGSGGFDRAAVPSRGTRPSRAAVSARGTRPSALAWVSPGTYRVWGSAGPWPVSERWWAHGSGQGAWLQVELEAQNPPARGGGVVLLSFREGQWWMEGVHD